MKNKLENAFDNYLKNYDMNKKQIRYKYHHSYRVKDLMKKLSDNLQLSDKEKEVAEVIGLLHDIGRFEQIKKYGDCSDTKTGIDHADESCIYLFDNGHIRDFYDDEEYYKIIEYAIKNHNKFEIDSNLDEKSLFFTKMIRDMDKVDIYKVITDEYKYVFDVLIVLCTYVSIQYEYFYHTSLSVYTIIKHQNTAKHKQTTDKGIKQKFHC